MHVIPKNEFDLISGGICYPANLALREHFKLGSRVFGSTSVDPFISWDPDQSNELVSVDGDYHQVVISELPEDSNHSFWTYSWNWIKQHPGETIIIVLGASVVIAATVLSDGTGTAEAVRLGETIFEEVTESGEISETISTIEEETQSQVDLEMMGDFREYGDGPMTFDEKIELDWAIQSGEQNAANAELSEIAAPNQMSETYRLSNFINAAGGYTINETARESFENAIRMAANQPVVSGSDSFIAAVISGIT